MPKWFRQLFATAEVDGITFYSYKSFKQYMAEKSGKHHYTIRVSGHMILSKAMCLLESKGVFDYEVNHVYDEYQVWDVSYYSETQLLTVKDVFP